MVRRVLHRLPHLFPLQLPILVDALLEGLPRALLPLNFGSQRGQSDLVLLGSRSPACVVLVLQSFVELLLQRMYALAQQLLAIVARRCKSVTTRRHGLQLQLHLLVTPMVLLSLRAEFTKACIGQVSTPCLCLDLLREFGQSAAQFRNPPVDAQVRLSEVDLEVRDWMVYLWLMPVRSEVLQDSFLHARNSVRESAVHGFHCDSVGGRTAVQPWTDHRCCVVSGVWPDTGRSHRGTLWGGHSARRAR
mmetsp:Transcript_57664/g.153637  ORF Transcript_57664/g.153637 Transcript_57664/m.153637 type:complete len:247 (+) Transcript_57664:900-1640(+)